MPEILNVILLEARTAIEKIISPDGEKVTVVAPVILTVPIPVNVPSGEKVTVQVPAKLPAPKRVPSRENSILTSPSVPDCLAEIAEADIALKPSKA